jgi:probable H4MPT-linked C1 transfer pathway protein
MAVVYTVTENDHEVGVIAEYFATMADVYRIIGKLKPSHDQTATADGRSKTIADSARRLSRMVGADFKPEELSRWQTLATQIYLAQRQRIENACLRQLNRKSNHLNYYFIGAGIGRFLVEEIANHLQYPYVDFTQLIAQNTSSDFNAGDCAPATAVAQLIYQY